MVCNVESLRLVRLRSYNSDSCRRMASCPICFGVQGLGFRYKHSALPGAC